MQNSKEIYTDVVVIGAGLTGLTTAHYLKKQNKKFIVLEKENKVGGVIKTKNENNFLFEEGPNTGVVGNTTVVELFEELSDKCKLELAGDNVKKRFILKNGKWENLPLGLLDAINTPLFTLKDKFRVLGEPFRLAGKEPHENLANFVKRRLGKSFFDYAIDPFIIGVYAGDPNYLIPKYALPKLYNLEQKYGSELVEEGGLKVTTTLNYDLQEKGEVIVKEGALKNEKDWNGKNAGLVAIDPKTGQILTMVGSRDYFDKTIDGNYNIATANRQPGSSFKPFIYATAFNKGFTPDTVLFDLPTEFQTTCDAYGKALPGHNQSDCYMPDDYDGKARGPMSLRNALAQSINIPAVKLFYLAGLNDSLKTAEDMGISTLTNIGRYGLTLVIGGGEVSLLDMTSAYGVFANNGIRNQYTGILKVEDKNGEVLEVYTPSVRTVLPENTSLVVSDVLSDNTARAPTFGPSSSLVVPGREVAVKTGTTNNNKDAWTIGYTPSVVVGVWAGNNDNKPMKKGGSAVAGPIWNKFMVEVLKTLPNEKFEKPNLDTDSKGVKPIIRGFWQGNENFFIDKISGKLATENTPKETTQEKVITKVHSILYWINKNDILGEPPTDPKEDPQFNHWEIPVQNWWLQNKGKYKITTSAEKPTETDDIHVEKFKPLVLIIEPTSLSIYPPDQRIQVKTSNTGRFPIQKLDIFINNNYIDTVRAPFNFSFIPSELDNLREENELKIISYDTVYNLAETVQTFRVGQ